MPFVIAPPFSPGSYDRLVATCGGSPLRVFQELGQEITKRFFAQQDTLPPSPAYVSGLWEALWLVALAEGVPAPLESNQVGEPKTLDDNYLFNLANTALGKLPRHRADDLLRTLCVRILIALLSPEFKACRQSYQQASAAGQCSRQDAAECRDRVSGSHCEDCPFFVALSREQHRRLLARAFGASAQTFHDHVDLFLPEDFRALRIFWHLHIRQPKA